MGHVVLDLTLTPEQGQEVFSGTVYECWEFVKQQGLPLQYEVVQICTAATCESSEPEKAYDKLYTESELQAKFVEFARWMKHTTFNIYGCSPEDCLKEFERHKDL